jgi:hypothetical protein
MVISVHGLAEMVDLEQNGLPQVRYDNDNRERDFLEKGLYQFNCKSSGIGKFVIKSLVQMTVSFSID